MTLAQTIAGIDVRLFALDPLPEEIASIVAAWSPLRQADFLVELGVKLRSCYGPYTGSRICEIAGNLRALERGCDDKTGSQLLEDLHRACSAENKVR